MIAQYSLRLDRDGCGHPYLVKERSLDYADDRLNSPRALVDMCNACFHLSEMAEEYLMMVAMDAAGHPLGVFELSHGTVLEAPAGIRELSIRLLLLSGAISCVLIHNHPSGCTEPSKEDHAVCRRIKEAATLLGFNVLDFIIIGHEDFLSFNQNNLL